MLIEKYPELVVCEKDIQAAVDIMIKSYQSKGLLLVCGNGGSASDAEHIVGELMKEFFIKRPLQQEEKDALNAKSNKYGNILGEKLQGSLPTIALTGGVALSTAFANDAEADLVFAQQVYGYGNPDSALLAISTSGNSKNVIYAVETAKLHDMKTIGLTGEKGGELDELCDVCIKVPSNITYEIQELHLPIYHTLCLIIEEAFFG
jgi:D-sedoheptulose 7-phosphate isomerase